MKSGTYSVKCVAIKGHPKITSTKKLRLLMNGEPTDVIVYTQKNGSPVFLAGEHLNKGKVVLVGKGPHAGVSATLRHEGLLRKLKLDVH
jgi:hypothetical protein